MIKDYQNIIISDQIFNILQKYNWKSFLYSKEHIICNRKGELADYSLNINYNNEELYFECVLDMELPNNKTNDLFLLINYVNEKNNDGYFVFDLKNKNIIYRFSIALSYKASNKLVYDLIDLKLSIADELIQNFTLSMHKIFYSETTVIELTDLMFVRALGSA